MRSPRVPAAPADALTHAGAGAAGGARALHRLRPSALAALDLALLPLNLRQQLLLLRRVLELLRLARGGGRLPPRRAQPPRVLLVRAPPALRSLKGRPQPQGDVTVWGQRGAEHGGPEIKVDLVQR
jgi:hypothetical protein